MPKLPRDLYHKATLEIMDKIKYQYQNYGNGKILVNKSGRSIYIEVSGKNLPYLGGHGEEIFPWETYVPVKKLERIESQAKRYRAEPWIAFCYIILRTEFEKYFNRTTKIDNKQFGLRLIKTETYRQCMKPRSPSWSVMDLPRKDVPNLTINLEQI